MKEDIIDLMQVIMKALKPFLHYFIKCTFPRSRDQSFFHIIGADVIFDKNCKPWILELNSGPSMGLEAHNVSQEMRENERGNELSPVDVYVKTMVLGHAVNLCRKSSNIVSNYEEYDSYTQIYNPDIDSNKLERFNIVDKIYSIFLMLAGQNFYSTLTMLKFTKIIKILRLIGGKTINRYELELIYKNLLSYHENMDFYCFLDAVESILNRMFPEEDEFTKIEKYRLLVNKFDLVKDRLFHG